MKLSIKSHSGKIPTKSFEQIQHGRGVEWRWLMLDPVSKAFTGVTALMVITPSEPFGLLTCAHIRHVVACRVAIHTTDETE